MYHCPEGASRFETWRTFCLLGPLNQKPPARCRHSGSALALTLMIPKSLTTDDAWASKSFYMHLLRWSVWCRGWPYSSPWSNGYQHLATLIANLVFQLDTPSKREPQLDRPVATSVRLFLMANCVRKTYSTMGHAIPKQVGLYCLRK